MIYWLTGQAGSGKTTLATLLHNQFRTAGNDVFLIDGDDLRTIILNKDYSKEGRYNNIRTAQNIAAFLSHKGHTVVVSLMSPYRGLREEFKARTDIQVQEIYVHTRDVRERDQFKVADYEEPLTSFINADTTNISVELSFKHLLEQLEAKEIV